MKEIQLTRGRVALVDDEDYERLNQYKWCVLPGRRTIYARRKGNPSLMHHYIMGKIKGLEIDHINGNGLDNQKKNLRHCTHAENSRNSRSYTGNSCYKGVSWKVRSETWIAQIKVNGKLIHLGTFSDEKKAALSYDKAARKHFGEFARCNFDG